MLVDYDLPELNGLELVDRARKLAHRSSTPIGVLSANPVEAEAREAGADVFLRKPHDIGLLAETHAFTGQALARRLKLEWDNLS